MHFNIVELQFGWVTSRGVARGGAGAKMEPGQQY